MLRVFSTVVKPVLEIDANPEASTTTKSDICEF